MGRLPIVGASKYQFGFSRKIESSHELSKGEFGADAVTVIQTSVSQLSMLVGSTRFTGLFLAYA